MSTSSTMRKILNPRFTLEEMEASKTKCELTFEITAVVYDDNKRNYPTVAIGTVTTGGGKPLLVNWNQFGECKSYGHRLESFDLIRPDQNELDTSNKFLLAIVIIIICSIV